MYTNTHTHTQFHTHTFKLRLIIIKLINTFKNLIERKDDFVKNIQGLRLFHLLTNKHTYVS